MHALFFERGRQSVQPLLERARDIERIGAELRGGLDEHARLARDQSVAESRLRALAYRRDIAEPHGLCAAGAHHRLRQGLEGRTGSLRLDHDALQRGLQITTADELGGALRRRQHIVEREPGRRELGGIDFNLPLAQRTAENLRLRHTRNREDLRLDGPLHHVTQFHRSEAVAGVAKMHQILHGRT